MAVGDALGVPVEFVQREVLKSSPVESMEGYGSHNQPVGTWSDDTSMVLATLDSMCRGFSTDAWRFLAFSETGRTEHEICYCDRNEWSRKGNGA